MILIHDDGTILLRFNKHKISLCKLDKIFGFSTVLKYFVVEMIVLGCNSH